MSTLAPKGETPVPVRMVRPDGSIEFRCPVCGRWLITAKIMAATDGDFVQAHCKRCKKERRISVQGETFDAERR
jgi:hypothetical protein